MSLSTVPFNIDMSEPEYVDLVCDRTELRFGHSDFALFFWSNVLEYFKNLT